MNNCISITINSTSAEVSEILIAALSENDYYAFEQHENALIAYIKDEDFKEEKLQSLLPGIDYEYAVIEDRNWNETWERHFEPVTVKDFVGIRASFHKPLEGVKHEIVITPKMSFGTGHHDTTWLVVEQMEKISFSGRQVLDFGTGTGILAILAEKLGAASVIAIDNDDWSINNATENIEVNHCKKITLEKRNNILGLSVVNIVLANINFYVLTQNAQNFSMILQPGSVLIISGFLITDEEDIYRIFVKNNFRQITRDRKNEWCAMVFEKY